MNLEQPNLLKLIKETKGTKALRTPYFDIDANFVKDSVADGLIEYFDMPDTLKPRYQSFTEADITRLRSAGFSSRFRSLEEGVSAYHSWFKEEQPFGISFDYLPVGR